MFFEGVLNKICKGNNIEVCFKKTPWQLSIKHKDRPDIIYVHFSTPGDAREQEQAFMNRGWISLGIEFKI